MQKVPAPSIWWCCPPPLVGASYSLKRGHSPYFLWISVLQRHRNYNMCQSTSWDIVGIKYRKRHKYTVNYGSNIAHLCNIVGKECMCQLQWAPSILLPISSICLLNTPDRWFDFLLRASGVHGASTCLCKGGCVWGELQGCWFFNDSVLVTGEQPNVAAIPIIQRPP